MKPSTRIGTGDRALCRSLACASLLVALGFSGRAHAQGNAADSDRANLLFKKGKVAFNAGKYPDALRIYNEAWSLKQSPDIAANLAQTESELGKHRDAAEHYAFALAHLLPSSTDDQKLALAEGLEVEKKEIGSLRVTLEPADSALTIDDALVTVPANGDVFVEPGEHRASVTHEGYLSNQQTVRISKGAAQVLWIKLQPTGSATTTGAAPGSGTGAPRAPGANSGALAPEHAPVPDSTTARGGGAPPPDLSESSGRSVVPAIVGGGLVAVGAAVGVVFLLSGNSSQNDADALRAKLGGANAANACGAGQTNAADCNALHSKNSDVDHARAIEVIGFSVAGAAAVGTALYLLWPQSSSQSSPSAASTWAPTLAVAPGAGSLGLTGRF